MKKRYEHYRKKVQALKGGTIESPQTTSGIELPDLYLPDPDQNAENNYLANIGFPGEFPFTRGVYPTMYRGRRWTMRQYSGFGTAAETNKRYRYLLSQGTTGISVAFDLPTQMGRDSDDPMAKGEVGRVGVAIDAVIEPAETRSHLVRALQMLETKKSFNPPKKHGNIPL